MAVQIWQSPAPRSSRGTGLNRSCLGAGFDVDLTSLESVPQPPRCPLPEYLGCGPSGIEPETLTITEFDWLYDDLPPLWQLLVRTAPVHRATILVAGQGGYEFDLNHVQFESGSSR